MSASPVAGPLPDFLPLAALLDAMGKIGRAILDAIGQGLQTIADRFRPSGVIDSASDAATSSAHHSADSTADA